MQLKSNFDFSAIKKAQASALRNFTLAGRRIDKLELPDADYATVEGILQKQFDVEMKWIAENPASAIEKYAKPEDEEETATAKEALV